MNILWVLSTVPRKVRGGGYAYSSATPEDQHRGQKVKAVLIEAKVSYMR